MSTEKQKRTGTNEACRTNDEIPKIGESVNLNLSGALAEKKYLENHPKPKYGWTSGISIKISQRITTLNKMIADLVASAERKTENGS